MPLNFSFFSLRPSPTNRETQHMISICGDRLCDIFISFKGSLVLLVPMEYHGDLWTPPFRSLTETNTTVLKKVLPNEVNVLCV